MRAKTPTGFVTTYKQLANAIACDSSQAVGQALKRNPYVHACYTMQLTHPIRYSFTRPKTALPLPEGQVLVPCHRVVASDLSLGGFHGKRAGVHLDKKRQLLESEGLKFNEDGKLDQSRVYTFK